MAEISITEYLRQAEDDRANTLRTGEEPALKTATVTSSGGSAQYTFDPRTRFVLIEPDGAVRIQFAVDNNPVANGQSPKKAANSAQFFGLRQSNVPAGGWKMAYING